MNENPLMLNKKFWEDAKKAFSSRDSDKIAEVIGVGIETLLGKGKISFDEIPEDEDEEEPKESDIGEDKIICQDCLNDKNDSKAKYCFACGSELKVLKPKKVEWSKDRQPPWNEINKLLEPYHIEFVVDSSCGWHTLEIKGFDETVEGWVDRWD